MSDFKTFTSRAKVEARQLKEDESVVTVDGVEQGTTGQWVVNSDSAGTMLMDDEVFQKEWATEAEHKSSGKGK